MNIRYIRFSQPYTTGQELPYIQQAIAAGRLAGNNAFTKKCQRLLEESLHVPRVMLTPSCTHALEMAALLLDIAPGDEVILPSFTFVSTANAFVLRGATPVFIDIRPDTLNMDERLLPDLITPRTKAIIPVHYAGVGCAMDMILPLAYDHGIKVVEDNAHGLFGTYHGQYLGTFGTLSTLSFHDTKNFTCGEGGALLVNDPAYIERAEIVREKGTDRSRFFRGEVDKYTWVDVGSSFLLGEIPAAFLLAQLEARDMIQTQRRHIWDFYREHLGAWAASHGVQLPTIPPNVEQAYHMFYLLMPDLDQRQAFIAHLKEHGISAVFHYIPLHLSAMGAKFGGRAGDCPVTEDLSERLVRLPFHNNLTGTDLEYIIETILNYAL
jgi:dTDP-4-amino-4,6-dideoxygalactose transaminase